MTSPYLLSQEAAAYLRVNRAGLYHLVKEHKLPFCRRGGLYLFDTRELDAWLRGHQSAVDAARANKTLVRRAS